MGPGVRASLAGAVLMASACGNSFSSTPSDAGSDVSTVESGIPDAPGGDSGGGSYCSTHTSTTFCEDFDESPTVTQFLGSWTTYSPSGGTFTFDTADAPSPPNALRLTTTAMSGVRSLVIQKMPPTGPGTIAKQRLEFDLRIDAASGVSALSAAAVAAILFGDDVSGGAVALAFGNGPTLAGVFIGAQPADGGLPAFGSSNAPPPFPMLAAWDGRFAIEIDYGAAAVGDCAQVFIGITPQLSPCLALPPGLARATSVSIALGVYSGGLGITGDVGVAFDDVTYNAE